MPGDGRVTTRRVFYSVEFLIKSISIMKCSRLTGAAILGFVRVLIWVASLPFAKTDRDAVRR